MMTERAELPAHVLNVGLTGGIGSGKSTVAQLMQSHGFAVIDLDRISHELSKLAVVPSRRSWRTLVLRRWLRTVRSTVPLSGERVFAEPSERAALEGILHPMIEQEVFAQAGIWRSRQVHRV